MKILMKKERGYQSFIERYDLNEAYAGCENVPIGVLILFSLVKESEIVFKELLAEADGDLGEEHSIFRSTDASDFTSPIELAKIFKTQELVTWELECEYNDAPVRISGRTYGSILGIRCPLSRINMIPLMSEVESATYKYSKYDQELVDKLKDKFSMNQRVAVRTLMDMEKEKDIFDEFVAGMQEDAFSFPKEDSITVEKHTAQELFENYSLSELGSYNYLIYLRHNPEVALKDLERGLPRK